MAKRYVAPRCNSIANIWKRSFETTDATFPSTRPYVPQKSPTRQLPECSIQNRLSLQQAQISYTITLTRQTHILSITHSQSNAYSTCRY